MPSFSQYQKLLGTSTSIGMAHKNDSDAILEWTWDNDISARDMYFYDWYHDSYKSQLDDLHPEEDSNKVKMRCKFLVNSTQTFEKDNITYHLQMKPSQAEVVSYYNELFYERYGAHYPIGLYVDIQDSKGKWNRWLVVAEANYNDPQFPTFELLRCDYILNCIIDNTKYNFAVVLRSQSSYNSGLWRDYLIQSPEDQQKFCIPINRDTEKLYYDQRLIIDNKIINREPRTWQISKVNAIDYCGVEIVTCAQNMFDEHKDLVELDESGNVIGLWADYYSSAITPGEQSEITPQETSNIYSTITYSGLKPEIKSGGSYKKFTVTFYNQDGTESEFQDGNWEFTINNKDASDLVSVLTSATSEDVNQNQIKVKFNKDDTYIGSILNIAYKSTWGISNSVDIEIKSL